MAALALCDLAELCAWEETWTTEGMKRRIGRRTARVNKRTVKESVRAMEPTVVDQALMESYKRAALGQVSWERRHMCALLGLVGLWRLGESLKSLHYQGCGC